MAAEQTRLRSWLISCYLQSVQVRYSAPTSGDCLSWLVVGQPDWGAMRHIQRQQTAEALREQHTIHVKARHSMQRYVPVGCVPDKQHR